MDCCIKISTWPQNLRTKRSHKLMPSEDLRANTILLIILIYLYLTESDVDIAKLRSTMNDITKRNNSHCALA